MYFGRAAALGIVYLLLTTLATLLFCGRHPPTEGFWWWVGMSQFLALPGVFIAATFTRFNVVSPGANDNLTGALASVGLARAVKEAGVVPENTEIIFMVTGSEEAGLCGADAYMRRHRSEWTDVETLFVALDTFRDLDYLRVYNRDLNGSKHHAPRLCALLQNAMRRNGLDHKFGNVHVGASDAAAFTRAGLPAAALCGMDPTPAHYYHCRRDSWEILDEECLFKTVQVLASALEDYDKNGLPEA
jgi:Zn-dependent M28 family amino/carboxypeptidase